MQKTEYEDFKYSIQDVANLYIGCKYTLGEIRDEENIMFKFRLIVERYILPEADEEDTLETHLYYLDTAGFVLKIYKQLKARVKVNIIEEKRGFFGKVKKVYATKVWTVEQLAKMPPGEKEKNGVIVQELLLSKLALMAF